jgi:hypothetical protein
VHHPPSSVSGAKTLPVPEVVEPPSEHAHLLANHGATTWIYRTNHPEPDEPIAWVRSSPLRALCVSE